MAVYLQFDSLSRSQAYIQTNLGAGLVWVPNDNYANTATPPYSVYQHNKNLIQTPSNYRVYYKELNDANNIRTIGFLAHCRERPTNLTYSVEGCTLIIPANALITRIDEDGNITYTDAIEEPYLYVRMMPISNAEGNLIYSNNPAADAATFIMWMDKVQLGTDESPPLTNPVPRPAPFSTIDFTTRRWIVYKTCMETVMRLDLQAEEWQIRVYDRYGNDVILAENDNGGLGYTGEEPPAVDPNLQTTLLVGIKPNYPL